MKLFLFKVLSWTYLDNHFHSWNLFKIQWENWVLYWLTIATIILPNKLPHNSVLKIAIDLHVGWNNFASCFRSVSQLGDCFICVHFGAQAEWAAATQGKFFS